MLLTNLHTHTCYTDGKNTPEQMVEAAIALGMESIGFSEHSLDPNWGFGLDDESAAAYRDEIKRLRCRYSGRIEVYVGLELDSNTSRVDSSLYDYIIGGVHTIKSPNGRPFSIDTAQSEFEAAIGAFNGDPYALCEAYYSELAGFIERARPDIAAHFDLITRNNEEGRYFDQGDPRYRRPALAALHRAAKTGVIFEINTGAMFRANKKMPFPEPFLLEELFKIGAPITISSDSHQVDSLLHKFDMCESIAREIGFKCIKVMNKGRFEDRSI